MTLTAHSVAGDRHAVLAAPEEPVETIANGRGNSLAAFVRLGLRRRRLRPDIELKPLQRE